MKAGHHVCIAYNDGRGTIRIRRPAEQPDIRRVLLYPETPIGVFDDQPPSAWPMPSVQFDLRDHEVAAFKSGL